MTRRPTLILIASLLAIPASARRPGDEIKPGFNLFTKQQDIQLGQQAAAELRKQFKVVASQDRQAYIRRIGDRLAKQQAPRESGFEFTYTLVNDKMVNAFALPGGPIFVLTGLVLASDNEAQIAGVLAHEMSHVILRHGTNQASKVNLLQIPALLAGAVTGSNLLAQLANLGAAGLLLKFSRNDETEADALGTRIMNEAGYNPIEMARFFEHLQQDAPQFLSDHPNPGNRVRAVQLEIRALPQRRHGTTVGDFAREKTLVAKLRSPRSQPTELRIDATAPVTPSRPSGEFKQLRGREFALAYPANWEVFGDAKAASVTIAPRAGVVPTANGGSALGYGVIVSQFVPKSKTGDLDKATEELIRHLHSANPNLRVASASRRRIRVEDTPGLITTLSGESPFQGQPETGMLLTVNRPGSLFYMIFVAPQSDFPGLRETFDEMTHSIRFSN